MTLYELTGQYMELMEMAQEEALDQKIIEDTMESVEADFENKADGLAKSIRSLEVNAEGIDSEIKRLSAKKKTIENNIGAMKRYLESCMTATGKKKFKTLLFGFGIQKNAPSLDVVNEEAIPAEFYIPQPAKLDRISALKYVKENGEQPWGRLKQTESLRIR